MSIVNLVLLCDGTSDLCLLDVIQWGMDEHFPEVTFRTVPARDLIPAKKPLRERIERTIDAYTPDVIFCHRDAEAETLQARTSEIDEASSTFETPVVPVVPVRMLESWLLCNESAIRSAANNPNGTMALDLPTLRHIENISDPKETLFSILRNATGLSAQRRADFNVNRARSSITRFVDDYGALRALPAFQQFEQRFRLTLETLIDRA